jgi:hypothetical protein
VWASLPLLAGKRHLFFVAPVEHRGLLLFNAFSRATGDYY